MYFHLLLKSIATEFVKLSILNYCSILYKYQSHCAIFTIIQGFKNHVTTEHNMWTYVYFSIYLDQIDTSDHNAIEKYVYDKVRQYYIIFVSLY